MKTKERLTDNRGRVLPSAERRRELITAFRGSGKSQAAFHTSRRDYRAYG
jgi:hypothetical protein